jgi:type II secretory pathway predicted ATPase ExeA
MYERFYHLSTNPFRLAPDPGFCFSHSGYTRAREYLEYALDQGEGFVMVTGRPGTGKTMLLETFLAETDNNRVVARRIAVSNYGADDLLHAVAYAYDIDTANLGKAALRQQIQQYFLKQEQAGRRVLLIIDEAQALQHTALEELRILADLQTQSRLMLQLFLVGQESLQDLMRSPDMEQFQQRVIANYHLVPLSLMEVRAYIEHRLLHAGWSGAPEFTSAAVLAIYQLSKGVPRHINKICNRLLLLGFGKGSYLFDKEDVQEISAEMHEEQLAPLDTSQVPCTDSESITSIPEIRDGLISVTDLAIRADKVDASASTITGVSRLAAQHKEAFNNRHHDDPAGWYPQHPLPAGRVAAPVAHRNLKRFNWRRAIVATAAMLAIATIFIAALPSILDKVAVKDILSFTDRQYREIQGAITTGLSGLSDDELVADELPVELSSAPVEFGEPAGDETGANDLAPDSQATNNNHLLTIAEDHTDGDYQATASEADRQPLPEEEQSPVATAFVQTAPVAEVVEQGDTAQEEQPLVATASVQTAPVTEVVEQEGTVQEEQPPVATASAQTVPVTEVVEQGDTTQDETIEKLLTQGQEALDEYQLVTPDGDNAYDYFRAVLKLDPASEDAQAGIQEIIDLYIIFSRKAVDLLEYDRAERYLERGLGIQPDNSELLALKDSVNTRKGSVPASPEAVSARGRLRREGVMSQTFLNKRQAEDRRREVSVPAGLDG